MALITGVSTALAIGGGLVNAYGQFRAGRQARKAEDQYKQEGMQHLKGQRQDIASLMEPAAYGDYMQSDMAQSTLAEGRRGLRDLSQQIKGGVARTGGTDAARQTAASTGFNEGYGRLIEQLAGHGAAYQDRARQNLLFALQGHGREKMNFQGAMLDQGYQQAGRTSRAGQGVGISMMDLAEALALPK